MARQKTKVEGEIVVRVVRAREEREVSGLLRPTIVVPESHPVAPVAVQEVWNSRAAVLQPAVDNGAPVARFTLANTLDEEDEQRISNEVLDKIAKKGAENSFVSGFLMIPVFLVIAVGTFWYNLQYGFNSEKADRSLMHSKVFPPLLAFALGGYEKGTAASRAKSLLGMASFGGAVLGGLFGGPVGAAVGAAIPLGIRVAVGGAKQVFKSFERITAGKLW